MAGEYSAGEVGGALAGIIAAAAMIGKGIVWIINWQGARADSRAARLEAWEQSLDRREREQRDEMEHRLTEMDRQLELLQSKVFALRSSLIEVTLELRILDPSSAAVEKANMLLSRAFPPDFSMPKDMQELIDQLDEGAKP